MTVGKQEPVCITINWQNLHQNIDLEQFQTMFTKYIYLQLMLESVFCEAAARSVECALATYRQCKHFADACLALLYYHAYVFYSTSVVSFKNTTRKPVYREISIELSIESATILAPLALTEYMCN